MNAPEVEEAILASALLGSDALNILASPGNVTCGSDPIAQFQFGSFDALLDSLHDRKDFTSPLPLFSSKFAFEYDKVLSYLLIIVLAI